MTPQRLYPRTAETPIERMFRKAMKRAMTKAERRWLQLTPTPIVRLHP